MSVLSLAAAAAAGLLAVLGIEAVAPGVLAWRNRRAPMVLVVASAVFALLADAAPTGGAAWDALLRAGFGAALAWAGSRARRNTVVVACVIAAFGTTPLVLAALGTAAGHAMAATRSRMVGAMVGLVLAQGLLRLGDVGPTGATTALGAVASGLVLVSALRRQRRRTRRRIRWLATAVVGAAGAAGVLAALAALDARPQVETAVDHARSGLQAASDDDRPRATRELAEAENGFRAAHRSLDAWWTKPALAVPVVAQQLRALERLAGSGAALAASGAGAAAKVDLGAVQPRAGTVDVRALEAMGKPLGDAFDALRHARRQLDEVATIWLLPPVADRVDDLAARIDEVYDGAANAAAAARLGPALLGADAPRRYLLLVVTPSELRGSGGVIGNFGEITAVDGHLDLARLERIQVLNEASPEGIQAEFLPAELLARYQAFGIERFWQNLTLSPDFPTVAAAAERLYPASGGRRLDGVISVDPIGLAGLLELTGPVTVEGSGERLTAENAVQILLLDQYNDFRERAERIDFLGSAARSVWKGMTSGELAGPAQLARVVGPLVRGRHLQLHSVHEAEQRFFARIDADGGIPPVVQDSLTVVTQNASRTKIDWFLRRGVDYRVSYDPVSGRTEATLTVKLANLAPPSGLSPEVIGPPEVGDLEAGQSLLYLSIYTPLDLLDGTVDGERLLMQSDRELGRHALSAFVLVEPKSTTTVTLHLGGTLPARDDYRLDVGRQPTVMPDEVRVRVVSDGRERVDRAVILDRRWTVRAPNL